MRKMVILSPQEGRISDDDAIEFIKYARNNNLKVIGETHYPPLLPLEDPKLFVDLLKDRSDNCVYSTNDLSLIFASVFTEGKLIGLLEQEEISVVHTELGHELRDIYASIDEDMKRKLKSAIVSTIEELKNKTQSLDDGLNMTILCKDGSDEEIEDYIDGLNYHGKIKVAAVCLNEYDPCMNSVIEGIIKKNNTDKLIIFDRDINDKELLGFIDELSSKYDFNYNYKDDSSIMMKVNEMSMC